jgi:hypothetical protein
VAVTVGVVLVILVLAPPPPTLTTGSGVDEATEAETGAALVVAVEEVATVVPEVVLALSLSIRIKYSLISQDARSIGVWPVFLFERNDSNMEWYKKLTIRLILGGRTE